MALRLPCATVFQALCQVLRPAEELQRLRDSGLRAFAAAAGQLDAIKALRERSGAPISEVKAALTEASWDAGKGFLGFLHGFESPSNISSVLDTP